MIKLQIRFLLLVLFMILSASLFSQSEVEDYGEIHVFDCYQAYFLDEDIQHINKVESDGEQLNFEYIPDKKQLILHDYNGKGKINCYGTSTDGSNREYSKSPCYIDPCENAL